MRFSRLAFLGVLSMTAAVAAACSTTTEVATGSTTTGTGSGSAGTGGTATATTSSSSTTTTTSGAGGAGGDDIGPVSNNYPAPHGDAPQVISYGGPVLAHPRIVPVFFSNDDPTYVSALTDFASKVGATQYWAANTAEYGVGAATSTDAVKLTETAPTTIDDTAIQTWLEGKLNSDDAAFPAADNNTVYALHYPAGTTITEQGAKSCKEFGGYHSNITLDGSHGSLNVAYAVIPRCGDFDGISGVDAVTAAESHELLEASTDPYPMSNAPAWASVDDAHFYWSIALGGGEIGDMCAQQESSFTKFPELPYTVQRAWSNKAAAAGHDPCVPVPDGEVYFNAVPEMKDTITLNLGQTVDFKGVKVPVGGSKTIDLDLFSDADTGGPWDVQVLDYAQLMGQASQLDLSLAESSGQNGQKLQLTIGVPKAQQYNVELFLVISTQGQQQNAWIGIVGN